MNDPISELLAFGSGIVTEIQNDAAYLGLPFDPNPLHSPTVQAALAGAGVPGVSAQPHTALNTSANPPAGSASGAGSGATLLVLAAIGIWALKKA